MSSVAAPVTAVLQRSSTVGHLGGRRAPHHDRPARARPHGFTPADLTEGIITDFSGDQQAFVESALGRTFAEGDEGLVLALSVVTDLMAMITLVRLTGGTTSGLNYKVRELDVATRGQLEKRLRVIFEPKVRAR